MIALNLLEGSTTPNLPQNFPGIQKSSENCKESVYDEVSF